MKKISYLIAVLAVAAPTVAFAQAPNWSQQGDFYAPSATTARQASPQELQQIHEGDFYAPGNTTVQQPTARQLQQFRQGDFYGSERN
jgi:hypothetical protein